LPANPSIDISQVIIAVAKPQITTQIISSEYPSISNCKPYWVDEHWWIQKVRAAGDMGVKPRNTEKGRCKQ
jgi:hypothetical protein